jgi:hypothetical protein
VYEKQNSRKNLSVIVLTLGNFYDTILCGKPHEVPGKRDLCTIQRSNNL